MTQCAFSFWQDAINFNRNVVCRQYLHEVKITGGEQYLFSAALALLDEKVSGTFQEQITSNSLQNPWKCFKRTKRLFNTIRGETSEIPMKYQVISNKWWTGWVIFIRWLELYWFLSLLFVHKDYCNWAASCWDVFCLVCPCLSIPCSLSFSVCEAMWSLNLLYSALFCHAVTVNRVKWVSEFSF